jgi:hypothetical protein
MSALALLGVTPRVLDDTHTSAISAYVIQIRSFSRDTNPFRTYLVCVTNSCHEFSSCQLHTLDMEKRDQDLFTRLASPFWYYPSVSASTQPRPTVLASTYTPATLFYLLRLVVSTYPICVCTYPRPPRIHIPHVPSPILNLRRGCSSP